MPRHINVMDLKVGDVVRLKSGGPEMTVQSYPYPMLDGKDDSKAECVWFEEVKLHKSVFKVDELLKLDHDVR